MSQIYLSSRGYIYQGIVQEDDMKLTTFATLSLLLLPVIDLSQVYAAETPQLLAQVVPANTLQAVTSVDKTLYLGNGDVVEQSLRVNSATTFNGVSIPAGSVIRGQFEPVTGGLRYVANGVQIGSRVYTLRAVSDTLHDVKDPRETSSGAMLGDAAIGAAGGALVTEVFGDASLGGIVGGAAAGVIVGNVTAQRVVVIEPNQAIPLQLQAIALN
jgi:hypothetical protein